MKNTQISPSMRLIHQGKVLSEHDDAQLRQAGIKDGSSIQVEHAGALKGGSDYKRAPESAKKRIWSATEESGGETERQIDTGSRGKSEF